MQIYFYFGEVVGEIYQHWLTLSLILTLFYRIWIFMFMDIYEAVGSPYHCPNTERERRDYIHRKQKDKPKKEINGGSSLGVKYIIHSPLSSCVVHAFCAPVFPSACTRAFLSLLPPCLSLKYIKYFYMYLYKRANTSLSVRLFD